MTQFQAHTTQEHTNALGNYFFDGKLASATQIETSNLRKLFYGISGQLTFIDQIFESVWDGVNILTTNNLDYITAWEGAVGIPDLIFKETTSLTIEKRREQILLKLRGLGTLTEADYIALGAILGIVITIEHPIDNFYPPYSVPFTPFGSVRQARFTLIFRGAGLDTAVYPPYDVPFTPTSPNSQVRELFEALKPANVNYIYFNS
jgi:hypothetical protein